MPVPPAEPIEDVLTSRVTPQRPEGGDGVRSVVDDDPHAAAIQARMAMGPNENNRCRGIRRCDSTQADSVPRKCAFSRHVGSSHDAIVNTRLERLQRISSSVETWNGPKRDGSTGCTRYGTRLQRCLRSLAHPGVETECKLKEAGRWRR